ncbi:MAG: hypothetical protein QXU73_07540 [Thermoplasmata archaeon]
MLRTVIYQRLVGLRHTTQLATKLRNSWRDTIPRNLGFRTKADGDLKVPDRRTIDRFIWKRLGRTGVNTVLDLMVMELRKHLLRRKIRLGRRIAIDSTPLEGMSETRMPTTMATTNSTCTRCIKPTCIDTGHKFRYL